MLRPDETYEDDGTKKPALKTDPKKFEMRSNNYFVHENEIMQLCEEFLKKYKIRPDFFCKFNPTIKTNECNYNLNLKTNINTNKKSAASAETPESPEKVSSEAAEGTTKPSVIYAIPKLGHKGEYSLVFLPYHYYKSTNDIFLSFHTICMNNATKRTLYVNVIRLNPSSNFI